MSPLANNPTQLTAEVIAVGTELLMGDIINSNASYLSKQLAELGVDVYYHAVVGDNPTRIKDTFKQAFARSNVLLVTGGLGPTDDDLTVATLAELFDAPLVNDAQSEQAIKDFFLTRDMPMSKLNLKQALRPDDGVVLQNPIGTAPGLFWDVTRYVADRNWGSGPKLIFCFPGVPREMTQMWTDQARPILSTYLPEQTILASRFLKFIGIGESMLADKLRDLMAQQSPTVSPYVGQAEVKIRIAAKADSYENAMAQITPVEAEILNRVGEYYYGADDEALEAVVGELLRTQQKTLAVAESCTGGLVSSRLTDVPGSSDYIRLNAVTYANEAKASLLGVSEADLAQHGAVSEAVCAQMAEGIRKLSGASVGLSLTGIAGPEGGSDEKPVGLVYIGLAGLTPEPEVHRVQVNSRYGRTYVKFWFSQYALNLCRQYLLRNARRDVGTHHLTKAD